MKKIFTFILAGLLLLPGVSYAEEKELVKVYVFEAGGCPFCEMQMEYLKGLDSYNKKFKIVEKEAYVDHVDWEQGKDYALTKSVAEAFYEVGFEDASYQGTPFVVISDKYAAAAYSQALEDIIDAAYEEGDKDIVSCIESGKTDCLAHLQKDEEPAKETGTTSTNVIIWDAVFSMITIASVGLMLYLNNRKLNERLVAMEKKANKKAAKEEKKAKKAK